MDLSPSKQLFVTGASRSGTTMLSRIFDQHSDVFSLNELHVFGDLIKVGKFDQPISPDRQAALATKICQRQQFGIWHAAESHSDDPFLQEIIDLLDSTDHTCADVYWLCAKKFAGHAGKSIPCEQTPRNIFYAKELLVSYPQAHIVHMVRDPRSVLASQKKRWQRRFLGGDKMPWLEVLRSWCNYHPITLSKLWVRVNQAANELQSNPRFHIVKFESLLESPSETLSALCHELDIDYQQEMLQIDHVGSSHQHNNGNLQGISSTTLNSWKESLSGAEIYLSQKICRATMKFYDYPQIQLSSSSFGGLILVALRFPIHILGIALFNSRRAKIQIMSMLNKSQ